MMMLLEVRLRSWAQGAVGTNPIRDHGRVCSTWQPSERPSSPLEKRHKGMSATCLTIKTILRKHDGYSLPLCLPPACFPPRLF